MHRSGVRPSVCLSHLLSNVNRAHGVHWTWLTRGQHATRPAYISVPVWGGRTYLFLFLFHFNVWFTLSRIFCPRVERRGIERCGVQSLNLLVLSKRRRWTVFPANWWVWLEYSRRGGDWQATQVEHGRTAGRVRNMWSISSQLDVSPSVRLVAGSGASRAVSGRRTAELTRRTAWRTSRHHSTAACASRRGLYRRRRKYFSARRIPDASPSAVLEPHSLHTHIGTWACIVTCTWSSESESRPTTCYAMLEKFITLAASIGERYALCIGMAPVCLSCCPSTCPSVCPIFFSS